MRWRDRAIGVVLGLLLGAGVVVLFVFVLSGSTVDAPSLSVRHAPTRRHRPNLTPPAATVRVIGGAPPSSGPPELRYHRGARVRLRVISDSTIGLTVTGYGVGATAHAGKPTTISFTASRPGTFALIVTASHIDVARITVGSG